MGGLLYALTSPAGYRNGLWYRRSLFCWWGLNCFGNHRYSPCSFLSIAFSTCPSLQVCFYNELSILQPWLLQSLYHLRFFIITKQCYQLLVFISVTAMRCHLSHFISVFLQYLFRIILFQDFGIFLQFQQAQISDCPFSGIVASTPIRIRFF